jgi:hypothetical protein
MAGILFNVEVREREIAVTHSCSNGSKCSTVAQLSGQTPMGASRWPALSRWCRRMVRAGSTFDRARAVALPRWLLQSHLPGVPKTSLKPPAKMPGFVLPPRPAQPDPQSFDSGTRPKSDFASS